MSLINRYLSPHFVITKFLPCSMIKVHIFKVISVAGVCWLGRPVIISSNGGDVAVFFWFLKQHLSTTFQLLRGTVVSATAKRPPTCSVRKWAQRQTSKVKPTVDLPMDPQLSQKGEELLSAPANETTGYQSMQMSIRVNVLNTCSTRVWCYYIDSISSK